MRARTLENAEGEAEAPQPDWDPILRDISDLRSPNEARVRRALARTGQPHPLQIGPLIDLLANDSYAFFAMEHLRHAAADHLGQLVDVLLDPKQPYSIRKRIPLILVVTSSQRAVDNLVNGLVDHEFLIRFRCALAIGQMIAKRPDISISHDRIWQVLQQELQVSREVWLERRLLEAGVAADDPEEPLERPGDASLEYVFALLGLVLPPQPVSTSFRALQSGDSHLRGTALEYLQTVLPAAAWKSLHRLIGEGAAAARQNGSA
jgi:hypothetical protein